MKKLETSSNNIESLHGHLIDSRIDSYEDFSKKMFKWRKGIKDKETTGCLRDFIVRLKKIEKKLELIQEAGQNTVETPFFYNVCWFYRWLLSEGYAYIESDKWIDAVRKSFESIKIPDYVIDKIKWAVVFCSFVEFGEADREDFYSRIIEKYSSKTEIKSFSDIIDSWMTHHILLRTRAWVTKNINTFEERLLLNYISLVDSNRYLEHIFGVAIEIDMELILEKIKKNEK